MEFMRVILIVWIASFFPYLANAQLDKKKLTAKLEQHYTDSDLPGFAVSLVKDGKVIYQKGFGYSNVEANKPYTPNTIQNIGSVTKTFVGVALIKAIEDGFLEMSTPINEILSFEVINPYFKETPILVSYLANHTSSILDTKHYGKTYIPTFNEDKRKNLNEDFYGFIKQHQEMSNEDFLQKILSNEGDWYKKKNFNKNEPGNNQEYSNLNAALMGLIIEKATGIPFDEYVKNKILIPLGMNMSGWNIEDGGMWNQATLYFPRKNIVPWYSLVTYPDGGLRTSVSDLSHYLIAMIDAYDGRSDFLSKTSAQLLLPGDGDESRAFWGMGTKSRNIGHGGSDPGVQTDMQFNADTKIGRIIFTNVNAEDNEELGMQYREIHAILKEFEKNLD